MAKAELEVDVKMSKDSKDNLERANGFKPGKDTTEFKVGLLFSMFILLVATVFTAYRIMPAWLWVTSVTFVPGMFMFVYTRGRIQYKTAVLANKLKK